MKPNEVRIDNWLMGYLDKKPVKVDWLVIKHLWDGNIQSPYDPKPVYEPIPLTPEILEKCGFEFKPTGDEVYEQIWNNGSIELWEHDEGFCHSYANSGDVNYLHQLMNLNYALTGEELNYQP